MLMLHLQHLCLAHPHTLTHLSCAHSLYFAHALTHTHTIFQSSLQLYTLSRTHIFVIWRFSWTQIISNLLILYLTFFLITFPIWRLALTNIFGAITQEHVWPFSLFLTHSLSLSISFFLPNKSATFTVAYLSLSIFLLLFLSLTHFSCYYLSLSLPRSQTVFFCLPVNLRFSPALPDLKVFFKWWHCCRSRFRWNITGHSGSSGSSDSGSSCCRCASVPSAHSTVS